MEYLQNPRPLNEVFDEILAVEPKPIETFVPADAEEQKEAFLAGDIRNPRHHYDRLEQIDFDDRLQKLDRLNVEIANHSEVDPKHKNAYIDFIEKHRQTTEMMQVAQELSFAVDEVTTNELEARFMQLNRERYGGPDKEVYEALLGEMRDSVPSAELSPRAQELRQEFLELLPNVSPVAQRYAPSIETVHETQELAESLYDGLLAHVPETTEELMPDQVAAIFREIITEEFGDAAADWQVVVTKAASINVVASDRLIKIPENRKPIGVEELRGLVAHEIGVHFLRAVMGEQTDLLPMRTGMANYYDAEEGLGKVMEQAVKGKYADSGVPYYLVAGMMNFSGFDFRTAHNVLWRHNVLKGLKQGEEIEDAQIEKARDAAYKTIFRLTRGTDSLPWFKDLAYYNGAEKMWKHMESVHNDFELFQFVTLGKGDATDKQHERIMYETKTV